MEYLLGNIDKLLPVLMLISMSIVLRLVLELFGQKWITTIAHTTTLVLLPLITYVITSVISGNIALALGMVGALSIVRFRNPVRSPLELSVYFGAITMGITASVSLMWLGLLVGSMVLAAISLVGVNYISRQFFNKKFFYASFSEGNSLSTLELIAAQEVDELDGSDFLKIKRFDADQVSYILVSHRFNDLQEIVSDLKGDSRVNSYQLSQ